MNSAPSLRGHHALQTEPDTELLQSPPGAQVRGAGRGGWRGRGHGRLFQTFQKVVGTRGQKIPIARLAGILWLVDYSCSGMKSSKKMTFKKLAGLFPIQTPLSLFAGEKKKKKKRQRAADLASPEPERPTGYVSVAHRFPLTAPLRGGGKGGLTGGTQQSLGVLSPSTRPLPSAHPRPGSRASCPSYGPGS